MISLQNLRCARCGADMAVPPQGATSVRCQYCGHEALVHTRAPVAPPQPPMPVPMPYQAPPFSNAPNRPAKGAAVAGIVVGLAALVALVVVGVAMFAVGGGSAISSSDDFQWRTVVVPVRINNDATEDFVGLYASRSEKDYPLYVAAFDGATRKQLWKAGPFGTAAHEVKLTIAGASVVVTDSAPVAHILALATGKETGKVALSDKADSTCAPTDAKGTVWVETTDKKSVSIDLATAVARAAPRPGSCPKPASDCDHVRSAIAGCSDGDTAPKVEGFQAEYVLTQGADGVAIGVRSPGTRTPMAVGFDPKDKAVRWQKALVGSPPSSWEADLHAADMAQGKLVAEYVSSTGKAGRLMALDVRTGAQLWDVPVPNTDDVANAEEVTITSTRVYLPHWTWLDIFDVRTGAHIETLGAW